MKKALGIGIFSFIILVLLLIVFSSYVRTGTLTSFSFKSLLDIFSGVPTVNLSFARPDLTIYYDWGAFNFLRSYINLLTLIPELILTIGSLLWEGITYIFFFAGLFFI